MAAARPAHVEPVERTDHRGAERAEEQLAVDGDVDDTGTLAEHAAEGTEDEWYGDRERAAQQADDRHGAARSCPREKGRSSTRRRR